MITLIIEIHDYAKKTKITQTFSSEKVDSDKGFVSCESTVTNKEQLQAHKITTFSNGLLFK